MDIRLEGIGKSFPNGVQALRDINLHIASGESLALVGPSGCGKTTLLRIIAGLESPSSGSVWLDGREVTKMPAHARQISLVFARPPLIPGQSVHANLMQHPWQFSDPNRDVCVLEMAKLLGIESVLDRRVEELSAGQQQRVALGRAFLRKTRGILLDEPLAHLDAPLRCELRREMRLLSSAILATMIHVTHDPAEALAVGSRVAVLHQGVVQQCDVPSTLISAPANRVVADLLSQEDGGIQFLDGTLIEESGQKYFVGPYGRWTLPASWQTMTSSEVTVGIRSRDLELAHMDPPVRWRMQAILQEFATSGRRLLCQGKMGRLLATLKPGEDVTLGESVLVTFDLNLAYIFERKLGTTLRVPTG